MLEPEVIRESTLIDVVDECSFPPVVIGGRLEPGGGEGQLQGTIRLPVCGVPHQPVPKKKVAPRFDRIRREHVHVAIRPRVREAPVLFPIGLASNQPKTRLFQRRNVGTLIGRVPNREVDVDDRLRRQSRHGRRPDMAHSHRSVSERPDEQCLNLLELCRPFPVERDDTRYVDLPFANAVRPSRTRRCWVERMPEWMSRHAPERIAPPNEYVERMQNEDEYTVDTDASRIDLKQVHHWLSTDAYWALGRSREIVQRAADGSLNFGVYDTLGTLRAYARVVTDYATFAWLCDLYVEPASRGRGIGALLAQAVVDTLLPMELKRVLLATLDAHDLYTKVGFVPYPDPQKLMVLTAGK